MKTLFITAFLFCISVAFGQTVPAQQPLEDRYHISYWWWVLGVLLAIGAGIVLYMLIKKDPKRDAL